MYFAQLRGLELEFEHYRRELATAALQPRVAGFYLLTSGQGLARFGRTAAARTALQEAYDLARQCSLHETLLIAGSALEGLDRGAYTPPDGATCVELVPPAVAHVIDDVRHRRELAGAAL